MKSHSDITRLAFQLLICTFQTIFCYDLDPPKAAGLYYSV